MRAEWEREFQEPLDEVLDELEGQDSPRSPIMERILFVSNDAFSSQSDNGQSKRLFIVSDLIQNSSSYSMYASYSWDRFVDSQSVVPLTAAPYMRDVTVEVLYMLRPCNPERTIQSKPEHWMFWERYFGNQLRASVGTREPISGSDVAAC